MTDIGIMIEGQEDLTWERWFRLAAAAEDLGFESLFRSDHLVALQGATARDTLALWPSLTALAIKTARIRFGIMVSPMTFRHPAVVAKSAAAVSLLSGGRLDLGLGAGWNDFEHKMYGIYYPGYGVRLQMLDEGAAVIKALWSGEPTTFKGEHYQLHEAVSNPLPAQPLPVILGGKGKKTLRVVAKHADEWNFTYDKLPVYKEKTAELMAACEEVGRDPGAIRRSIMMPYVVGRDEREIQKRIDGQREGFPFFPSDIDSWIEAGYFGGTPDQVVQQLGRYVEAGVSRFFLQHLAMDDVDSLELLAAEVLPQMKG